MNVETCPICGNEMTVSQDVHEHVVHEYSETCNVCRLYDFQYAHGNGKECVGNIEIHDHHADDEKQRLFNQMVRSMALSYFKTTQGFKYRGGR
ncbi:hypothetical protein M2277_004967 [Paenibacillus sp. LBL]|nr:hypothetical protein [Paenibacillus sp. LBL]